MSLPPPHLTSPSTSQSVLVAAVDWVQAILVGPIATTIAVIAIAAVGISMLNGRVNLRRGATVILGCFILFGSGEIAAGLRQLGGREAGPAQSWKPRPVPEPHLVPAPPAAPTADPYAGAAVRR